MERDTERDAYEKLLRAYNEVIAENEQLKKDIKNCEFALAQAEVTYRDYANPCDCGQPSCQFCG